MSNFWSAISQQWRQILRQIKDALSQISPKNRKPWPKLWLFDYLKMVAVSDISQNLSNLGKCGQILLTFFCSPQDKTFLSEKVLARVILKIRENLTKSKVSYKSATKRRTKKVYLTFMLVFEKEGHLLWKVFLPDHFQKSSKFQSAISQQWGPISKKQANFPLKIGLGVDNHRQSASTSAANRRNRAPPPPYMKTEIAKLLRMFSRVRKYMTHA